ncbi:MAG: methylmalonyl-CoA mutase family protein, partial [Propionibacteriaceae bacterium]|nr:methylmalonyl-CoA mutase family protein [Propionibacteriaceae bacterium]
MIPRFDSVELGDGRPSESAAQAYADALAAAGASDASWETPELIAVPPLFSEDDLEGLDFLDTRPGLPPFLRGPYSTMYVNRPWTIRQYAGFSTAAESNAFYRRNLAAGQKGL